MILERTIMGVVIGVPSKMPHSMQETCRAPAERSAWPPHSLPITAANHIRSLNGNDPVHRLVIPAVFTKGHNRPVPVAGAGRGFYPGQKIAGLQYLSLPVGHLIGDIRHQTGLAGQSG